GKDFDCRFTYKVQDEAGGIAQALGLAENFVGDDVMNVILGDNIFQASLQKAVKNYPGEVAQILLKVVADHERFGVAEVAEKKIIKIEEKPDNPQSIYAVTGIYMYGARVFDYIRALEPSGRGELEITDVNNHYISSEAMRFSLLEGWWTHAGTP